MKVAIVKDESIAYPKKPPFHPGVTYPEYPFQIGSENNLIYERIRQIFLMLGMDEKDFNSSEWNPLGEIIKPTDNVLIKPNLVRHYNLKEGTEQLLTHGSLIRAVIDYVYIALGGKGKVTIADAPVQDGNFREITQLVGIDEIIDFYNNKSNMEVNVIDFRKERGYKGKYGEIIKIENLDGDPLGYSPVDLKEYSELYEINDDYPKFRVTNYNKEEMLKHHNKTKNEYLISNTALNSDVIINLPKLKSHRKAGMTGALKNMVGINGSKDWLPHHRTGSIEEGGDEYLNKSLRKRILTSLNERRDNTRNKLILAIMKTMYRSINTTRIIYPYKDPYFEGSWYGNDTISRVISDLNKIVFYADNTGKLEDIRQRKMFILVDAIIGGQKEGPLQPSPINSGFLIAGYNPVAVDLVCCKIMGYDSTKIPTFQYVLGRERYNIMSGSSDDIEIISDKSKRLDEVYESYYCNFIPSKGWKDHIEYRKSNVKQN